MMKTVEVEEFQDESEKPVIFDVRSPIEYQKGHIPNAISFPLFSDEERKIVGTIYKQKGQEIAIEEGLKFVGPKMACFVREARILSNKTNIHIHCWRGGKRSQSMAWLLSMVGMNVKVLNGGYKAYRNKKLDKFIKSDHKFIILAGLTGAGKTDILHQFTKMGEQILDLEGLANHKGSAFGHIGEKAQPTIEQFTNDVIYELEKFDLSKPIWVEGENRSIGRVFIFDALWSKMQAARRVEIEVPYDVRVQNLVNLYGNYPKEDLKDAFKKIQSRLGGLQTTNALNGIDDGDLATAAKIGLFYYDKSYKHSKTKIYDTAPINYLIDTDDHQKHLDELIQIAHDHFQIKEI